jgi:hypothetical protein
MRGKMLEKGTIAMVALSSLIFVTCSAVMVREGGERSAKSEAGSLRNYACFAVFYYRIPPDVFLTSGSMKFSNVWYPVTGEEIKDAIVKVGNTTSDTSRSLDYKMSKYGNRYTGDSNIPHNAGDSLNLQIVLDDLTITMPPTVTPDTDVKLKNPVTDATVSRPFTIEFEVTMQEYAASHVWIRIWSPARDSSYSALASVTSGSYQIDSSMIQPGKYRINVVAVNLAEIEGLSTESFALVESAGKKDVASIVTIR